MESERCGVAEESKPGAEEKQRKSSVAGPCEANDLLRGWKSVLLWCAPICAVFAGISWPSGRPWLWIPAFLVMGVACLVNAARCGRLHCYLTGPLFLLAAGYVVVADLRLVPMRAGIFVDVVLVLSVLACLAEVPYGRYGKTPNAVGHPVHRGQTEKSKTTFLKN